MVMGVWGLARKRRGLAALAMAGIFGISWPPLAWMALQPLEGWYPKIAPDAADAEAIVVLASGILPAESGRLQPEAERDTYARCWYAAWLYRHRRPRPVLACGGRSKTIPVAAARVMRDILIALGVPEAMVWVEDRSSSTYENALYAAGILRAKGIHKIVLITAASHMPRSERCFRKQGLAVIPAPCDFTMMLWRPEDFIPDGKAILDNERALHEYVGLGWYLLTRRI
jgi:uncharacterized SAM-binding protein YcdF (DUF218 family)